MSAAASGSAAGGPVRVLQVLPTFDPAFGGPVSAALGVSASYDGVALTTVGGGSPGAEWDAFATRGFRTFSSPVGPRYVLALSPGLLVWAWRRMRSFDLLHLHYNRSLTLVWLPLLARMAGVPYVLQTHGMCSPWQGPRGLVDRLFTRPALRHAWRVCVLGEAERTDIVGSVPEARVVTVHNVVRTPERPAARPDRPPRLLFCARLHPRKGLSTFLDVVERLGVEGHVVGPDEGALAAARARVQVSGAPVTFHGGLDRDAVDAWMASCDVLVHPAPGEPFGMSMLEAFAAGLPVVASASSALAPVFAAEGAALLPADGDVEQWCDSVRSVLECDAVASRLTAGGRAVLDRHFSRESLRATLSSIVRSAVAS
jgi:glycosyltransferase involved in cell wall biosynthesis